MAISLQTNVASMIAENNLSINNNFQTQTITRLTSGYRINSSGDDAAGLAVANSYRSTVAELNQGVRNANDGVSTLQIIDGGLANISTMLDRMKTLATQAASNTFTGSRATLDGEYQTLMTEIDRQAGNIGLGTTNAVNSVNMGVYIGGGGAVAANSQVQVGLAGSLVDRGGLGLTGTSVNGATNGLVVGGTNLNTAAKFLVGGTQVFTFTNIGGAGVASATVTVAGGSAGITATQALQSLNSQLAPYNITAGLDTSGHLQFQSTVSFTAAAAAGSAGTDLTGGAIVAAGSAPLANTTGTANALAAIASLNTAIGNLGTVQGIVGAGENKLQYAINLANSQITSFSAADSRIRDADVATEAANLTKAQVLEQASVAAMAQANAAPQIVLALLKG
ncbi:MAG TPA: flagellin [Bryobacteraceae bacterium]|nr:flagellin [Bryobacteraceae bacterium]